jgi:hypothetical protein
MTRDEMTRDEMTSDEMTRDEMIGDEMTGDEITRSRNKVELFSQINFRSIVLFGQMIFGQTFCGKMIQTHFSAQKLKLNMSNMGMNILSIAKYFQC